MRTTNSTKAMTDWHIRRSMRSRWPDRVSITITTANATMHSTDIPIP